LGVVADLYEPRRFASTAGVLGVFVSGAKAASPLGLGASATALGTYDLALWALVVLGAAAAAAVYVGDRRR
jgi:hypothetical protein